MGSMLLFIRTINENVIKENQNEFPKEGSKNIIHEGLKSGWSVCKAKGHYLEFVMSVMGSESCLRNIFCS